MKRVLFLIILLTSINLFSDEPFVEIYKTHDNGLYGLSTGRDIVLSIKHSVFSRFNSIEVNDELDFLTYFFDCLIA